MSIELKLGPFNTELSEEKILTMFKVIGYSIIAKKYGKKGVASILIPVSTYKIMKAIHYLLPKGMENDDSLDIEHQSNGYGTNGPMQKY